MGSGLFLVILSLQTAIFWGEYSKCQPAKTFNDTSAECKTKSAMISATVFAVFMFLTLIIHLLILFMYKDAILGSGPLDEGNYVCPRNMFYLDVYMASLYRIRL